MTGGDIAIEIVVGIAGQAVPILIMAVIGQTAATTTGAGADLAAIMWADLTAL